jgi:hypothetical protein
LSKHSRNRIFLKESTVSYCGSEIRHAGIPRASLVAVGRSEAGLEVDWMYCLDKVRSGALVSVLLFSLVVRREVKVVAWMLWPAEVPINQGLRLRSRAACAIAF